MAKYVAPSIESTSFNCPHCGALAQQFWRTLYAKKLDKDSDVPLIFTHDRVDEIEAEAEGKNKLTPEIISEFRKIANGVLFVASSKKGVSGACRVSNLFVSVCYQCAEPALWLRDRILWPLTSEAPEANPDLPPDIRADYEEAGTILNLSPRGAAALLRLVIQKLCAFLETGGKDLNKDIGILVERGLDKKIQQALDIVRVIGNNAVHPGVIDLKDDLRTATQLFTLVNLIAEKMISEPKHINDMFDALPDGAKKGIENRDKKD